MVPLLGGRYFTHSHMMVCAVPATTPDPLGLGFVMSTLKTVAPMLATGTVGISPATVPVTRQAVGVAPRPWVMAPPSGTLASAPHRNPRIAVPFTVPPLPPICAPVCIWLRPAQVRP